MPTKNNLFVRYLFIQLFLTLLAGASQAAPLTAEIRWEYTDVPALMHIYELTSQRQAELWETGNGKALSDLPIASEIPDGNLSVPAGGKKRFVLVLKNETDKPIYFFAAPHQMAPASHSLGFKFKCLCVNHVYTIPPHEYWYRVVELRLETANAGGPVTITHNLVRVDSVPPGQSSKPMGMDHEM